MNQDPSCRFGIFYKAYIHTMYCRRYVEAVRLRLYSLRASYNVSSVGIWNEDGWKT